jgi:response regulator RpfG family c-di-GMP phosphodiesterase
LLVLTAAIVGQLSEQREAKLLDMRKAYIGVLEIMLRYLEVADEQKPRALRISLLSGKIATALGLRTSEMENIKSAALLYEAGDLRTSLPLFEEVVDFTRSDMRVPEMLLSDEEHVKLKTTASLLKEIAPILFGYFKHYIEEENKSDKDLKEIPMGSSIIALADLYDRVSSQAIAHHGGLEIKTLEDIEKLAGRAFPSSAIQALKLAVMSA